MTTRGDFLRRAALAGAGAPLLVGSRAAPSGTLDGRANVLFVLTDDQPHHTMRVMNRVRSRFSGGLNLTASGYSAIPLCGPARASLWTGLYPHNHGCISNDDAHEVYCKKDRVASDVFSRLAAAGYHLGFFGKIMNGITDYRWRHPAFDESEDTWIGMMGGAENPKGFTVNYDGNQKQPGINTTRYFTREAAKFIERKKGVPWFAYVPLHDPHTPLLPEYGESHDGERYSSPGVAETDLSDKSAWSRTVQRYGPAGAQARYEGALEELETVDERVNKLFDVLAGTGQLDNTLVVFSSDNGFMFGEHGAMVGKGIPYEEVCRLPFFVRGPGIPSSLPGSPLVGHLDITATILKAAGLPWGRTDGRPLQHLGGPWRKRLLVEHPEGGWAMLREGSVVYAELPTGETETYDLAADPYQLENLAASSPGEVADLSAKLAALRGSTGDALRGAETAP